MGLGFIVFIIVLVSLPLWIIAAIRFGKARKLGLFFVHVGLWLFLVSALWFILAYPVLDCLGILCGLGELLLFLTLALVSFFTWGLILLIYAYKRY